MSRLLYARLYCGWIVGHWRVVVFMLPLQLETIRLYVQCFVVGLRVHLYFLCFKLSYDLVIITKIFK